MSTTHIRWMLQRDLEEVLAIERESFRYPWSDDDFIRCLRNRNCIGMVTEYYEEVVGFMIYELHKSRLNVLNFAVRWDVRRQKVGTKMLDKLIGKLATGRRERIELLSADFNLPAHIFLRANGFKATGIVPNWSWSDEENVYDTDAYRFEYHIRSDSKSLAASPVSSS